MGVLYQFGASFFVMVFVYVFTIWGIILWKGGMKPATPDVVATSITSAAAPPGMAIYCRCFADLP